MNKTLQDLIRQTVTVIRHGQEPGRKIHLTGKLLSSPVPLYRLLPEFSEDAEPLLIFSADMVASVKKTEEGIVILLRYGTFKSNEHNQGK